MINRVWQLLLSVRTALVLILLLAGATFAGTMLAQVPATVPLGGDDYREWIESVRPRFGMWTDALAVLGLFNVFRAWWYQTLTALLALSIVACTIHRWNTISREVFRPQLRLAASVFDRDGTVVARTPGGLVAATAAVSGALTARGYRVLARESDGATLLYADRNRYARFGTLLAHASLVLLLLGAALGARLGWSDDGFVVPEGSTRAVGVAGLSLQATSFVAEYYASGQPKDYRSAVVLYQNGSEVERSTIRVNEPLEYDGVRFYQSFFGPAAYLRVSDTTGALLLDEGVPLAWRAAGERPAGAVSVPGKALTAYLVAPSTNGADSLIRPGEVRLELYRNGASQPFATKTLVQGQDVEAGGLRFSFVRERQFTGLRVTRDPTLPIIWVASALFVVGLVIVFGFPYRRMWVRVATDERGARASFFSTGRRDPDVARELARLAEATRTDRGQKE